MTDGLTQKTYLECEKLLEAIPQDSTVKAGYVGWAKKHLAIAEKLGLDSIGLPISSDILESLFGTLKQHGTGAVKDAYRMALRIPAMCGVLTIQDARIAMGIPTKEVKEMVGSIPSLTKQRRQILPTPGNLNEIQIDAVNQTFELIPRSKNRSKNPINQTISDGCCKRSGPAMC